MKPLVSLFFGLVLGVLFTKTFEQPARATTAALPDEQLDEWLKPGAVMGIHHMILKEGVDRDEAERFLKEEYFPGWRDAMPGSRVFMLEGERGAEAGTFAFFWVFEDLDARNRYFPDEDGPTDEYRKYRSKLDWLYAEDKFPKYGAWSDGPSTDYVVVQ